MDFDGWDMTQRDELFGRWAVDVGAAEGSISGGLVSDWGFDSDKKGQIPRFGFW